VKTGGDSVHILHERVIFGTWQSLWKLEQGVDGGRRLLYACMAF
jgi:hypothetical protein